MVADEPDPAIQPGERGDGRAEPAHVTECRGMIVREIRGGGRDDVGPPGGCGTSRTRPAGSVEAARRDHRR